MKPTPLHVQRVYLILTFLNTLAASMIWGVNTLFLLDAGLSNTEAFLANSFFTLGQVIFEIPTGIVADLKGRSTSYMIGTITLGLSTLLYLFAWSIHSPLWLWAVASILLGLGFTFFSGATEAWLVDALEYAGYEGTLDTVFGRGQTVSGVAMLLGSVGGGIIAQLGGLALPYYIRAVLLFLNFIVAFIWMKDWGFFRIHSVHVLKDIRTLFATSIEYGWRKPAIRWVFLAGPFISGVSFYAFYAMQPYLLSLYHDPKAYAVAGSTAAIVALAQIAGGLLVPRVQKIFATRTQMMLIATISSALLLAAIGLTTQFWIAVIFLSLWGLIFAFITPVRQSYLNGLIPSKQRATVLSFDNSISSAGGAIIQPGLGRCADLYSYGSSFLVGAICTLIAFPFLFAAKRQNEKIDDIVT